MNWKGKTVFDGRIVHGMFSTSLISTVIGMYVPGPGTIYMEHNCRFLKPVRIGDTLTAESWIDEIINSEKGILRLKNRVINQDEACVIEGYSVVKVKKEMIGE